ncbi:kinase-like domain-containing protein [Rhizophagus diaphanus]|nr:kinase-like domain-containing protein [Rhizophagus diaphanus] [Rhizophagus sp. MUCL 43196]
MSKDNYKENEIQVESELDKLNISDNDSNSVNINHKNCYNIIDDRPWCKECVPHCIIEGCTSENHDIDEFIKDTIYNAKMSRYISDKNFYVYYPIFIEWVPFDRFEDIKQIGEGGFAKVYSATWVDVEYLNELQIHWDYCRQMYCDLLKFYGMTKDLVTKEFMMIVQFSEMGNLRSVLSKDFNNILWNDKINFLYKLSYDLYKLHNLEYYFGLSGSLNKQKSDGKIFGVLPYIAPEVLNGEPYTLSSDIYSLGVIMAELSSGKPPFHKRKHDAILALEICNGLRPEFGKGTPEIYKKSAYRYVEEFSYKFKEIKALFEEANKEIPNISTTHEKNPDAILFTFSNLSKPINSPIISSYLNEEENKDCQDSQLLDLEVSSSSLQSREIVNDGENSS